MQMYELDAYLGDFANDITDDQKADLLRVSDEIDSVYGDDGELDEYAEERQEAFSAAVQYVMGDLGAAELRATQRVAANALLGTGE